MLSDELKATINERYKRLAEKIPGFRRRRSQAQMIGALARGLTAPAHVVACESPTGTGKSFAYLIAAHAVAQAMEKKLLLVTHTVALQEQLCAKDIPLYLNAVGVEAKVSLVKGRGRYACWRNLHQLTNNDESQTAMDFGDEVGNAVWPRKPRPGEPEKIARLLALGQAGKWDGDIDAAPEPVDAPLQALLSTSAGGCSKTNCRFYHTCAFYTARRGVREADLIVTNASLLLSDLMLSGGEEEGAGGVVLPKPSEYFVVVDEAHHLGSKAIEQFAASVHLESAMRSLGKSAGVVRAAFAAVGREKLAAHDVEEAVQNIESIRKSLLDLQHAITAQWIPDAKERQPQWRAPQGRIPQDWQQRAEALALDCKLARKWSRSLRRKVLESSDLAEAVRERMAREIGMFTERVEAQIELWAAWTQSDEDKHLPRARWVSLAGDNGLVCHASDVSAAAHLRKNLFEQAAGVALTSATLSAGGNFAWLARSLGLPEDAECVRLDSPFDLARQASVVIPALEALPNEFDAHVDEIARWIEDHLPRTGANLVLFTSKMKLKAVYDKLSEAVRERVQVQGDSPRPQMLAEHARRVAAGQGSTLFGTAALGEGLDLAGNLLTTVVITQVPFQVPTDPVSATYAEWLESQNRNPFAEVAIPDATRLLTQYAGRLVRTEQDTGQIVILDRRLVRQRYGKRMLDALPPFRRVIEPSTKAG